MLLGLVAASLLAAAHAVACPGLQPLLEDSDLDYEAADIVEVTFLQIHHSLSALPRGNHDKRTSFVNETVLQLLSEQTMHINISDGGLKRTASALGSVPSPAVSALQSLPQASFMAASQFTGIGASLAVATPQPRPLHDSPIASPVTDPQTKHGHFRPVSMTVRCTIFLAVLHLIVYISLALARNLDELNGQFEPSWWTDTLVAVSRSTVYLPLMSCLFVACRMHVLANTEGLGEPDGWVKKCMCAATTGITVEALITFAVPFMTRPHGVHNFSELSATNHCDVHPHLVWHDFTHEVAPKIMHFLSQCALAATYLGISGVIGAILLFSLGTGSLPVPAWSSPSFVATVILTIVFMFAHFGLWYFGSFEVAQQQETGDAVIFQRQCSPTHDFFIGFCSVIKRAPLLAVLFVTSRLRAMELDPWSGRPPQWARHCFYIASVSLCLEALVQAWIAGTGEEEEGYYGIHIFKNRWSFHLVRHVFGMVSIFWATLVALSIPMQAAPHGAETTPLPPSMECVLILGFVSLLIYFSHVVAFSLKDIFGKDFKMLQDTVLAASVSVSFSPMCCILFIAARLRAVQVTNQAGNPQQWAQDTMFICVFAIILQAICCLLLPIFTGMAASTDEQGNAQYDLTPMVGAYAVTGIKYFSLFCLCGGVLIITASIFLISPTTAQYLTHGESTNYKDIVKCMAIVLLAILVSLLLSSAKVVGLAIKFAIESVSGSMLGAELEVDKAMLSVFHGFVQVKGVVLRNPQDEKHCYLTPYMIKVDNAVLHVDMSKLVRSFGKTFEFKVIEMIGLHVNLEKPSLVLNSNVALLLSNLNEKKIEVDTDKDVDTLKIAAPVEKPSGAPTPDDGFAPAGVPAPSSCGACSELLRSKMPQKRQDPTPPTPADAPSTPFKVVLRKIDIRDVMASLCRTSADPFFKAHLADIAYPDFYEQTGGKPLPAQEVVLIVVRTLLKTFLGNTGLVQEFIKKKLMGSSSQNEEVVSSSVTTPVVGDREIGGWTTPV